MGKQQGQGFNKPMANKMLVDPAEIQKMQTGYEMRIARQRDAITRLQNLAAEQTEKFAEWMRDEIGRTGRIDESDQAPVLAVAGGGVISDEELDSLLILVTAKWDLFNEDATARDIVAGYIKFLEEDVEGSKAKQGHLAGRMQFLFNWVERRCRGREDFRISEGTDPIIAAQRYIEHLEFQLAQARTDARHNARVANANVVVDGDDTPPWEKGEEAKSFVQPATVGSSSVFTNEPGPEISETLTDWAGAQQLPPGEQRPGSF